MCKLFYIYRSNLNGASQTLQTSMLRPLKKILEHVIRRQDDGSNYLITFTPLLLIQMTSLHLRFTLRDCFSHSWNVGMGRGISLVNNWYCFSCHVSAFFLNYSHMLKTWHFTMTTETSNSYWFLDE